VLAGAGGGERRNRSSGNLRPGLSCVAGSAECSEQPLLPTRLQPRVLPACQPVLELRESGQ